jgi:hypothetical protein
LYFRLQQDVLGNRQEEYKQRAERGWDNGIQDTGRAILDVSYDMAAPWENPRIGYQKLGVFTREESLAGTFDEFC